MNLLEQMEEIHRRLWAASQQSRDTTYKNMCEAIEWAGILRTRDGGWPTAGQIFNYSPTGELFRIEEWFLAAAFELLRRAH